MKELGIALRSLFEKLGEFFHLFDLSFVVSGVAALGALLMLLDAAGTSWPRALQRVELSLLIPGLVLASYILGLFCFALGRLLRDKLFCRSSNPVQERLLGALMEQGLDHLEITRDIIQSQPEKSKSNTETRRSLSRLYTRLWAALRVSAPQSESFSLLKRYWVMAATFDGLSAATLLWAVALTVRTMTLPGPLFVLDAEHLGWGLLIPLSLLGSWICSREAGRYGEYQVEELVATIAELGAPLLHERPSI